MFLILSILLAINVNELNAYKQFNPKGHNYCRRDFDYCAGEEHSACWCHDIVPQRRIINTDQENFRQTMVDVHNEQRNSFAKGDMKPFPSASDMCVMSYNFELEYIAECHGRKINYTPTPHDKCRSLSNGTVGGQNIYGIGGLHETVKPTVDWAKAWVNERFITDISDVRSFSRDKVNNSYIAHFTLFMWATLDRLGCTRVDSPKYPALRTILICNYISIEGSPGNMLGYPVYTEGKPASDCPFGYTPSKRYPALCGYPGDASSVKAYIIMIFIGILINITM